MIKGIIEFARKHTAAVSVLAITSLFFLPVVTSGKVPLPANFLVSFYNPWAQEKFPGWDQGVPYKAVGVDDLRIFYPQRMFTQQVLKTGELPFWNPYSFSGNYHIGLSETAVFYPLFFIFSILPQSLSWVLLQISQPIIAFVGMYFFLKYYMDRRFAFFGGLVFGFSGIVLVRMVEGLSVGHTLIWLPYAFWGIEGFLKEKKIEFLALFTGAMVLSVLAGWFQFAFYLIGLSFLYAIFRTLTSGTKEKGINLLVFLPFILVPLLTLFHILPALDTLSVSPREAISVESLQKHLLSFSHAFTLFYPDYWGNPATLTFFGKSEYKEAIVAIGVIPTLLAIFSLIHLKKHKIVIFFALIAIIAFVLGTENSISKAFMNLQIPVVSSFLPDRIMYLVSFSLATLSAFGFRAFIEEKKWRSLVFINILLIVAVVVILSHRLIADYLPIPEFIKNIWSVPLSHLNAYFDGRPGIKVNPVDAAIQAKNVIIGDGLILLFCLVFLGKKYLKNRGVYVVLLSASLLGQIYFGYKYIPFSYTQFIFPVNPVFTYLQNEAGYNRFITAGSGYIPSNMSLPYKIYSPDGVSSMYPRRYGELVSYVVNRGDVIETPRIEARLETPAEDLLRGDNPYMERFMQIDGVKYIVVLKKDLPKTIDSSYDLVWEDDPWQIYEYKNTLPRVLWTNKYEVVSDERLLSRLFDKSLPTDTILLEREQKFPSENEATGTAEIKSYMPNKIIIDSNSQNDGFVYLSDSFSNNFIARVDNIQVELLRGNYAFRVIPVSKGSHTITLEYKDEGFVNGARVSFITLVVAVGGIVLLKRRRILS